MIADEPSTLEISGGTHNTNSPTVHFLRKAFLPIIERMGPKVTVELDRHGFYPAGGGLIRVRIAPAKTLRSFELLDRGEPVYKEAVAMVADLATDIAVRELACVKSKLAWQDDELRIKRLDTGVGPGNVLSLELAHEHICEVFTGFGERNVSANRVANKTAADVRRYLASGVPVWEHLADQLLLPIAMAGGGEFRTCVLTPHTQTNIAVS